VSGRSALIASAAPPIPDVVAAVPKSAEQKGVLSDADLETLRNGDWKRWVGFHRFPNLQNNQLYQ
jgi:hypothetical protein